MKFRLLAAASAILSAAGAHAAPVLAPPPATLGPEVQPFVHVPAGKIDVERSGGRIINFSTTVVGLKLETYGVYVATKAAVEGLTGILAKELRGRNITVNAVAPGPTGTDLFLNGKSPELIDRMAKMNPLERLGTPEDIANVVAFLASPEGGWINGQVLRANGGMI